MTGLLDQRRIDAMIAVAQQRVSVARELVRGVMFADGPDASPPGFDNLDSPDKVRVFTRFVSRQANREQSGAVPGNLNQTIAQHPDVQQMAQEVPSDPSAG